jgi:hypothetical protein
MVTALPVGPVLAFAQSGEENDPSIRKFQRVVAYRRLFLRPARCSCHLAPEIARLAAVLHQSLIEPDDVKWYLTGQDATTVLNCPAQGDVVRVSALSRVVRRGDDVRQVKKRLIDAELAVAYRFNPPGIDAGSKERVLSQMVIQAFPATISPRAS